MISSIINAITGAINGADKLFTSDDERNQFALKMQKLLQQPYLLSALRTIAEANNPNRKWRTWTEWLGLILTFGIAYNFLLVQILNSVSNLFVKFTDVLNPFQMLDHAQLISLIGTLLGFKTLQVGKSVHKNMTRSKIKLKNVKYGNLK